MASAEFQGNVLLRHNVVHFVMALLVYAILSMLAYWIGRRLVNEWRFYFVGGLLGLVVIEWWLVGFYPGSGKPGIHAAMFTNWAAVFSLPRFFTSPQVEPAHRRKVRRIMIGYSFGAPLLVIALPIPPGGTVAILMTIYSLALGFALVPFLAATPDGTRRIRRTLQFLTFAAVANVLLW